MTAMCCKSRFSRTLIDDGKFKLSCKVGTVAAVIISLVALSVSFAMLSSHLTDQENPATTNVKISTQQTPRSSTTEGYNNTVISNATAENPATINVKISTQQTPRSSTTEGYKNTVISNATAETQSGCPYWAEQMGYTYNSTIEICYFYQKYGMCTSWNAAHDTCANDGGHLLFVPNQETNTWLIQLIRDSGETPFVVYIDGTDKISENTFKNYRNETIIYTQWAPHEPQGFHPDEDCIGIRYYQWVDARCSKQHVLGCRFVCQINSN